MLDKTKSPDGEGKLMSVSTKLNEAVKNWLNSMELDCVDVVYFDESVTTGSCGYDTCSYEDWAVDITFRDSRGKTKFYAYEGKFSSLISLLDQYSTPEKDGVGRG